MSNTKTDGMSYEIAGAKSASRNTGKKAALKVASQLGTPSLVWLLVKRHKVALLAIGNVVLVLNWALPQWPEMVKSIVR